MVASVRPRSFFIELELRNTLVLRVKTSKDFIRKSVFIENSEGNPWRFAISFLQLRNSS
jgi:hypothetical protein